jgi:hypothetical protein
LSHQDKSAEPTEEEQRQADREWAHQMTQSLLDGVRQSAEQRRARVDAISASVLTIPYEREPSREDLYRMLDACLDLAQHQGTVERSAEIAAAEIWQALSVEVLGWAAELERPRLAKDWDALAADPGMCRHEIWYRIQTMPPLWPAPLKQLLSDSILSLDDGHGVAPALFQPELQKEKGANPKRVRECQEYFWWHIWWREGQGWPAHKAEGEISEATSMSPGNVQKWREHWKARDGSSQVEIYEKAAKECGRLGQNFAMSPDLTLQEVLRVWNAARKNRGRGKAASTGSSLPKIG